MKKLKNILILIALFMSAISFAQSTTSSFATTLKMKSNDNLQIFNAVGFIAPLTFTGSPSTISYSSTLPFSSTDALQIYNGLRMLGAVTPTAGGWGLTGNTLGNNTSYLGSNDNRSLILETNGAQRFKIDSLGYSTIGTGTITANTTTLGVMRVKQGSAFMDFGEFQTGYPAIWLQKATPSATNWQITDDANKLYLNGVNGIDFRVNQVDKLGLNSTGATVTGNLAFTGSLTTGALGYTDTGILSALTSSVNGYNQFIIRNTSNAINASANVIVGNDLGTASTNYGEFGMNSSTFTGTPIFNQPNATYLTATSGNLNLGTTTEHSINIAANNSSLAAISISTLNAVTVNTLTTRGNLSITNTVTNVPTISIKSGTQTAFILCDGSSLAMGSATNVPTEFYYNNLLKLKLNDNQFRISESVNFTFGTTTGTKFGESTSQKLAFFNSTPIIQPTATTDILTVLSNLGLRASGTAAPLTSSGAFVLSSAANVISVRNLKGTGTAVTTTTGSAIGTNGTCTVTTNSTNTSGLLTITTGTAATGISGTLTAVNFANSFGVAPNVVLTPANSAAALLTGGNQVFVSSSSTSQFFITSGTTALNASTVYRFYYHVIE